MANRTKMTKELYETIKKYSEDQRGFSQKEIAALTNVSLATCNRVLSGAYDEAYNSKVLEETPKKSYSVTLSLEKMEYLLACKNVVNYLMNNVKENTNYPGELFIGSTYAIKALQLFVPSEFEALETSILHSKELDK